MAYHQTKKQYEVHFTIYNHVKYRKNNPDIKME